MMWTGELTRRKLENRRRPKMGQNSFHLGIGGSGGAPLSFRPEPPKRERKFFVLLFLVSFKVGVYIQAINSVTGEGLLIFLPGHFTKKSL